MANPREEGDPFVLTAGYQPTNCLNFEDPNLVEAKKFIKRDKKHNCCNFWQDGKTHINWVQEWQRPDAVPKVFLEKASTNTTFLCLPALPRHLMAEED